jgi:GDPmannose 4,6-dehydratase
MRRLMFKCMPDEVYHLAGPSHVGISFENPESTSEMNAMGTLRLLDILRDLPKPPRFYNASSSEIFGMPEDMPQHEETPMKPVSPYGVAKAFATQMTRVYRQCFGLFACNGIAYNHESIRRGENFITRKVCRAAAAISLGRQDTLSMGDLASRRDWGHAPDYVRGMWLALNHEVPDDYVFATGVQHSVQNLVEIAFSVVELEWRRHVRRDPAYLRPADPDRLVGCPAKAERILGWRRTTGFAEMIRAMVRHELEELRKSG